MGKWLRNPKHERFCRAIALDGKHPRESYVLAGFEPNRANYNKLLRRSDVKARIEELIQEREASALAARTPIADVLSQLTANGIDRVGDFFEAGPDGLVVRDLSKLRVEIAMALLNALHDGTGIIWDHTVERTIAPKS